MLMAFVEFLKDDDIMFQKSVDHFEINSAQTMLNFDFWVQLPPELCEWVTTGATEYTEE